MAGRHRVRKLAQFDGKCMQILTERDIAHWTLPRSVQT
jgi:hypothetical protein